ncbi:MAG: hypothetical protein GX802_03710 [Clostridiales bacterium]|jgi:hypothetical protein|nr:hypothetical protein [Clostridiales bacterium]
MKYLNQLIDDYTALLQNGELQAAYKGIMDYMSGLRNHFSDFEAVGGIYQGYMDMTYFSLNTQELMGRGLKIAVVYLHDKKTFEVWLSARNREISNKYRTLIHSSKLHQPLFHEKENTDAIIEYTLTSTPDFDNQAVLTEEIIKGTREFAELITGLI